MMNLRCSETMPMTMTTTMTATMTRTTRKLAPTLVSGLLLVVGACSSHNSTPGGSGDGGANVTCANAPTLGDTFSSCTGCTQLAGSTCTDSRPIQACCAWVEAPKTEAARGLNLHYFSSSDPTLSLGCLTSPATLGTPQTATVTGFVKLFSHGQDSAGVKI